MTATEHGRKGVFASASLIEHLLRGIVGIALLAWAILHQTSWLALIAGALALIAFRGCPMCWTLGLIETVQQRFKRKNIGDESLK